MPPADCGYPFSTEPGLWGVGKGIISFPEASYANRRMSGFYDILSIRNPKVKELFRLRVGGRRAREKTRGKCLVRGKQLVESMGSLGFKFKEVYSHQPRETFAAFNAEKVIRMEKDVLKHILFGTKERISRKCEDDDLVLGQIEQPEEIQEFDDSAERLLMIDRIKQPENMGRLLSSAVALKFDGVIFNRECVDPFSYKVLETSQGVAWTLPYRYASNEELIEFSRRRQFMLCAGSPRGWPLADLQSFGDHRGFCLIIGNEGDGVHKELLKHCTEVALPMSELMESLTASVAGGILMHSLSCTWNNSLSKIS
eukprot:s734_g16.t1